jgi:hypothetical protein
MEHGSANGGDPPLVLICSLPDRQRCWLCFPNAGDKATHDFLSLYSAAKDSALPLLPPESKPPPPPASHQGACATPHLPVSLRHGDGSEFRRSRGGSLQDFAQFGIIRPVQS